MRSSSLAPLKTLRVGAEKRRTRSVDSVSHTGAAVGHVRFTQLERQHLKRMRYEGRDDTTPEEVTAA